MTTVLIMAGGTGGHVFPALAVARVLQARSCDVVWLGTRAGIEARVVPAAGIPLEWISVGGLRGKGVLRLIAAPFALARALVQALGAMQRRRPDVVLGLGGFASGPGGIAAWLTRRPLVIHEQNAVAGLTNRVLSRFASRVAEAFPGSFGTSSAAVMVGNPVRAEIEALPARATSEAPRRARLLVFGGSLGAQVLNRFVPAALAAFPVAERPEVLHQTGRGRQAEVVAEYRSLGVEAEVSEFIDDMAHAYAWADVAVCRSGALTVAELAAAGLPSVLVPYPSAVDDHQTANARFLESRGAAVLLPEDRLRAGALMPVLRDMLATDATLRRQMAKAARGAALPGAAERLADLCLDIAGVRA